MVFQVKTGHAHEIVEGFRAMAASATVPQGHVRILTDLSGPFDTVVQEVEVESIDAFLKESEKMFADPKWQQEMSRSRDLMVSGSKEYYTIEYSR